MDTELVSVPENLKYAGYEILDKMGTDIRECLESVSIPESEVDKRVLDLRDEINNLNKIRAEKYGRSYTPPNIVFIDRERAVNQSEVVNRKIREKYPTHDDFDANAAYYQVMGNTLVLLLTISKTKI